MQTIKIISIEQVWQYEQTRYWYDVDGEVLCAADTNGEWTLLDNEGYPIDNNALLAKLALSDAELAVLEGFSMDPYEGLMYVSSLTAQQEDAALRGLEAKGFLEGDYSTDCGMMWQAKKF